LTGENQFPPNTFVQVLTAAFAVIVDTTRARKIVFIGAPLMEFLNKAQSSALCKKHVEKVAMFNAVD